MATGSCLRLSGVGEMAGTLDLAGTLEMAGTQYYHFSSGAPDMALYRDRVGTKTVSRCRCSHSSVVRTGQVSFSPCLKRSPELSSSFWSSFSSPSFTSSSSSSSCCCSFVHTSSSLSSSSSSLGRKQSGAADRGPQARKQAGVDRGPDGSGDDVRAARRARARPPAPTSRSQRAEKQQQQMRSGDALIARSSSLRKEVRAFLEELDGLPLAVELGRYLDKWVTQISVRDLTAVLKQLGLAGDWRRAWQVFDWMTCHDQLQPDLHVYTMMISILGRSDKLLRYATSLFESMESAGCMPNVYAYNALLNAYAKNGRVQNAFDLFTKMKAAGIRPDVVTYTAMVSAVASGMSKMIETCEPKEGSPALKRGKGDEKRRKSIMPCKPVMTEPAQEAVMQVRGLFAEMEEEGIVADVAMYSSLMKAFLRCGDPRGGALVIDLMKARGSHPTLMMYNQLLDAYGKAQAFGPMESLGDDIEQEEGCLLSLVSYNTMMDAYARVQRIEDVERIKKRMVNAGFVPNDVTYAILLGAYGRVGMSHKAARTMDAMRDKGYQPHGMAYLGLIDAYSKAGLTKKAMVEFERMKREGIRPTVEVFTVLMDAYRRTGEVEEMHNLWKELCKQGCKPTRATFIAMLGLFSKLGMDVRARTILTLMKESAIAPGTLEYNMLMNAYARANKLVLASGLLEEMKKKKVKPDTVTFTTLIFMYIKDRLYVKAEKIYKQMLESGEKPDEVTDKKMRAVLDAQMRRFEQLNEYAVKGHEKLWVEPKLLPPNGGGAIWPGRNQNRMTKLRITDKVPQGKTSTGCKILSVPKTCAAERAKDVRMRSMQPKKTLTGSSATSWRRPAASMAILRRPRMHPTSGVLTRIVTVEDGSTKATKDVGGGIPSKY